MSDLYHLNERYNRAMRYDNWNEALELNQTLYEEYFRIYQEEKDEDVREIAMRSMELLIIDTEFLNPSCEIENPSLNNGENN